MAKLKKILDFIESEKISEAKSAIREELRKQSDRVKKNQAKNKSKPQDRNKK